jgi:hypothetical protein
MHVPNVDVWLFYNFNRDTMATHSSSRVVSSSSNLHASSFSSTISRRRKKVFIFFLNKYIKFYINKFMKIIEFHGTSRNEMKKFPEPAKREAGHQLMRVQHGLEPSDWKPMPNIGQGVR